MGIIRGGRWELFVMHGILDNNSIAILLYILRRMNSFNSEAHLHRGAPWKLRCATVKFLHFTVAHRRPTCQEDSPRRTSQRGVLRL